MPFLLALFAFKTMVTKAQKWEAGILAGPIAYRGDLAKPMIQVQEIKMHFGLVGGYVFNSRIALKNELNFGAIGGNDKYAPNTLSGFEHQDRNLNFKSNLVDFTSRLEFNFLKPKSKLQKNFVTPFITIGIGVFHFDPYTYYNNEKIYLHKLQTELDKPLYALTQLCIPVGGGLKIGLENNFTLGLIYEAKYTKTDYIDDVSHNWQSNVTSGSLGQSLTYRGDKSLPRHNNNPIDPTSTNRGDPTNHDNYVTFSFSLIKTIYKAPPCGRF